MERLLDRQTFELVEQAMTTHLDPDQVHRDNAELITRLAPTVDRLMKTSFRLEVEGLERGPRGRALVVVNHEAGITFAPIIGFGARWYLRRVLPVLG